MFTNKVAMSLGFLLLGVSQVVRADGLTADYGRSFPSIQLNGKTHKVLGSGVLKAGERFQVKGIRFERNAMARVFGVGLGDGGDLDFTVTDGANGQLIGKDILIDNVPVVSWQTGNPDKAVVNVLLENRGSQAIHYVIIANY